MMVMAGAKGKPEVFLLSNGDVDLNIKMGVPLLGLGKIKWWFAQTEMDCKENDIEFKLKDSKDVVFHDSKDVMTLQKVIEFSGQQSICARSPTTR